MKTQKFTLFTIFILFALNSAFAQIKVFSNNKVQVGPLWWQTYPVSEQFFINGDMYVNCYPAIGGLYFKNYNNTENSIVYDDPSLVPQHSNGAWLGTPTKQFYKIYSNEVFGNQILLFSDSSLKTNIHQLATDSSLHKILALKAYRYDYKLPNDNSNRTDTTIKNVIDTVTAKNNLRYLKENKNQIGLMAQELKTILPEAVKQDELTGNYSVNYIMLIPLLIESIKEQQKKIDQMQLEIAELKK